jgi:hypothetical protein
MSLSHDKVLVAGSYSASTAEQGAAWQHGSLFRCVANGSPCKIILSFQTTFETWVSSDIDLAKGQLSMPWCLLLLLHVLAGYAQGAS